MSTGNDIARAALEVLPDVFDFIERRVNAGSSVEEAKAEARAMYKASDRLVDAYQEQELGPRR